MDFVNLVTIQIYGTTAPIGVQSNGTQLTRIRGGKNAAPIDALLRPAATVKRLDCLLGCAAYQDTLNLRSNLSGPLLALFISQA